MDGTSVNKLMKCKMERTAQALRRNRMEAYIVDKKEEIPELLAALIPAGSSVGMGGSMTLRQSAVLDWLQNGNFDFLDWTAADADETEDLYRKAFSADVFLASANAVTENGELCNLDGDGNRVAAMIFGPREVIIIAGCNKIVENTEAALRRIKEIAAPANAIRLGFDTPCAKLGKCVDCRVPQRICSNYTVMGWQQIENRVKVILVAEPLGF